MDIQRTPNQWYAVTGGPSSGKTTLLKLLERRGYATVPEMARHYIDERLAHGELLADIERDQIAFQHAVLEHQLNAEHTVPRRRVTFFDRGIPDTLAYYRYHHMQEDEMIRSAVARCSYKKVFMLDVLPVISDYARTETEEQQHALARIIREVYAELPFPIVRVPVMMPNERAAFVLEHL